MVGNHPDLTKSLGAHNTEPVEDIDLLALAQLQLFAGLGQGTGLTEHFFLAADHLIATNDKGIGKASGHSLGLFPGKAKNEIIGRFVFPGRFIHFRCVYLKGKSKAGQECSSIGARGG